MRVVAEFGHFIEWLSDGEVDTKSCSLELVPREGKKKIGYKLQ